MAVSYGSRHALVAVTSGILMADEWSSDEITLRYFVPRTADHDLRFNPKMKPWPSYWPPCGWSHEVAPPQVFASRREFPLDPVLLGSLAAHLLPPSFDTAPSY
jgi:hypothetical protein